MRKLIAWNVMTLLESRPLKTGGLILRYGVR